MIGSKHLPLEVRDGLLTMHTTEVFIVDSSTLQKLPFEGIVNGARDATLHVLAGGETHHKMNVRVTLVGAMAEAEKQLGYVRDYLTHKTRECETLEQQIATIRRECSAAQAGTMDPARVDQPDLATA